MADHSQQITELADLMNEFGLSEAHLESGDLKVSFRRPGAGVPAPAQPVETAPPPEWVAEEEPAAVAAPRPGTPIHSPMTGIFYASPSPSEPPYVKVGESVTAGQTIALIEAMKVFNEVPSPISGVIAKAVAKSGDLVQNGDLLFFVE